MKVAQLFENSPNLDQLYNNQDAQCYLYSIFVMKMVNKYAPGSLSLSRSWVSSLASSLSVRSLLPWLDLSVWLPSASSSLSDNEKAKYQLLYNRMMDAKKRYEAAGGKIDKRERYVR